MRRTVVVVLAAMLATLLIGTGCGSRRYTRDQVRDRWVNTFVAELDLAREQAACIVDRFLGETTDAELRPLTNGDDLSDAQAQRIGEIALTCGVGG